MLMSVDGSMKSPPNYDEAIKNKQVSATVTTLLKLTIESIPVKVVPQQAKVTEILYLLN